MNFPNACCMTSSCIMAVNNLASGSPVTVKSYSQSSFIAAVYDG
ncbi:hypothetical protein [Mitsuokella jalaludinii]